MPFEKFAFPKAICSAVTLKYLRIWGADDVAGVLAAGAVVTSQEHLKVRRLNRVEKRIL
jgi:hypothetical protein